MKFYSEKLDRIFDTEKELKAEELKVEKAEAAKKQASEAKKAEAKVVEDAYKAYNAAKRTHNVNVLNLRKQYNEDLKALKKAFDEATAKETKVLEEAEAAFDAALKEFTSKHPEGYHMTLKDGDNVLTLSSNQNEVKVPTILDPWEFWNDMIRAWRF